MLSEKWRKFSECPSALTSFGLPFGFTHPSSFSLRGTRKTEVSWGKISRRAIKMVRGWSTRLLKTGGVGLFSLERSQLERHPAVSCQCHWGGFQEDGVRLLSNSQWKDEKMDRDWKKEGCIQVDIREICFTMKNVKQWKRMCIEDVSSLCLEVFKICLNKDLSNIIWPHSWVCWKQDDPSDVNSSDPLLDGRESLSCSDLPKTVEQIFSLLQLWVQDGKSRRHEFSWISFLLYL